MSVELMQVSRDGGKTWSEEEIDIENINVSNCSLKPGDIILRGGQVYEIRHVATAKRIDTIESGYACTGCFKDIRSCECGGTGNE